LAATHGPGMRSSLATTPIVAASHTPAASPTPSMSPSPAASPAPSSAAPSPAPTPPPLVPTGRTWTVGGAAISAGGAFALDIDSAGTDFTGTVSAGNRSWSARFGVAGDGPVSAAGVASGPSPVVVDSTIEVFRLPISVRGTLGKNMSVTVGTASSSALSTPKLVASVHGQGSAPETSTQTATRIAENTIRTAVAFTLVGWLLLAIFPGLRARTYRMMRSGSLRRLGLGALLALDVPLAALLVAVIGVPLGLWWIGLVALAIFAAIAVAGYAYAGFQIGALLLARSDRPR